METIVPDQSIDLLFERLVIIRTLIEKARQVRNSDSDLFGNIRGEIIELTGIFVGSLFNGFHESDATKALSADEAKDIAADALYFWSFTCSNAFNSRAMNSAVLEVYNLANGDIPNIFSHSNRKRGQHPRQFALKQHRAFALLWDDYLKSAGYESWERRARISRAFRADWDTIRKWRNQIRPSTIIWTWFLEQQGQINSRSGPFGTDDFDKHLQKCGDLYWLCLNDTHPDA